MLSIMTGGGHAPDSCDGPRDGSNGRQQSKLGKVVHSEVMDCGSAATVIQFTRLTKDALASAITQAAANRVRRESSGEREGMYVCILTLFYRTFQVGCLNIRV